MALFEKEITKFLSSVYAAATTTNITIIKSTTTKYKNIVKLKLKYLMN